MKRAFPPHARIFKLTFTFFGTGMVMFVVAMIAGIWIFPQLLEDQSVRNVNGWALAHLFLLGWATMIAMGASYQLTQVLLRTNIYSRLLGVIHYIFYVIGFLLLIVSFIISFPEGLFIGGLFVLIGVIVYIGNIVKTFMKKRAWSLFHLGVTLSLGALLLTVMTGLFMGLSFNRIRLPFSYESLLATHLWLGIGGWLSGLIIVYSFKLIPMFYSSPRRAHVEAYMILLLFHGGIWCRMVAIWWGRGSFEIVAHLCIVGALGIYVRYLADVPKQTRSHFPVPGGSISLAYYLNFVVFILIILWTVVLFFIPEQMQQWPVAELIGIFLILGWFSGSILSYLSKIIPFLWWGYQFQTTWEKKSKIRLTNMTRDRHLRVYLCAYLFGVILVCAAYWLIVPMMIIIGQIIAVCAVILYVYELSRVLKY